MKPESEFSIVFDQAGGREAQFVRDKLDFFNVGVTGESTYYPVHFFLKNERGEVYQIAHDKPIALLQRVHDLVMFGHDRALALLAQSPSAATQYAPSS